MDPGLHAAGAHSLEWTHMYTWKVNIHLESTIARREIYYRFPSILHLQPRSWCPFWSVFSSLWGMWCYLRFGLQSQECIQKWIILHMRASILHKYLTAASCICSGWSYMNYEWLQPVTILFMLIRNMCKELFALCSNLIFKLLKVLNYSGK